MSKNKNEYQKQNQKNSSKNKKTSNGFKNQPKHKLIENQSPNKITDKEIEGEYEEESKKEYNKVTVGFQNLGNTCYLNTALQTIRQISCISSDSLPDTIFCETLKILFQSTNCNHKTKYLNFVFDIMQNYQIHLENGGDAYQCLINLLRKIYSEITNKKGIEQFQKSFQAIFEDGVFCNNCKKYEESKEVQYCHIQEEIIGIEDFSLNSAIIEPQSLYQDSECKYNCSTCNQPTLKPFRAIISAPKFLIFKVIKQEISNQRNNKKKAQKQTNYSQLNTKIEDQSQSFCYNLIGCSELSNSHYTYTAKYDDQWYRFNDSYGQKIENFNINNNNNINYLLYINDK
ncbi:ubiquitin carboxy-terminal hydrolase (macronuclear) [Tetrahymena thermophila SB210]|uniref:Ubiquitin carboxy-terminal hydrolase n=1 Tax=Tetrahymena thermophila (strain SB210) TaxID=312017 RepID=Q238T5_TETTS|nr:ubiquitin carboxy-terminal hydrolase [Tetrahymena thermophila SB210]EAR93135.1 ubiquitin carboxy-terminal hydrolase [Tetrahymena thermophila SB210]|eukprot:XP_001013380.1 ubiquitin carboxy-terminal hydrolase [Tetrahymena thermophila SB210]